MSPHFSLFLLLLLVYSKSIATVMGYSYVDLVNSQFLFVLLPSFAFFFLFCFAIRYCCQKTVTVLAFSISLLFIDVLLIALLFIWSKFVLFFLLSQSFRRREPRCF